MTNIQQSTTSKTLVIGASSSIGESIVNAFLNQGASVTATYNSNPIIADRENLTFKKIDLSSSSDRDAFIDRQKKLELKFDTVVVLPSIIFGRQLHDYSDHEIDRIVDVNFTAQAKFIRDILQFMAINSCLILIGSIASERGSFDPLYAASKGAMIPFSKSLAKAYGENFATLTLLPGPIADSTMFEGMSAQTQARHIGQNPSGQLLTPLDLAKIIVDISNPHWRHANGSIIRINGGAYV